MIRRPRPWWFWLCVLGSPLVALSAGEPRVAVRSLVAFVAVEAFGWCLRAWMRRRLRHARERVQRAEQRHEAAQHEEQRSARDALGWLFGGRGGRS